MTIRFFSGSRDNTKSNAGSASAMMRDQLRKNKGKTGSINMADNYKKLLENKLKESKFKAQDKDSQRFSMLNSTIEGRSGRSKKALELMKQMEEAKEAKKKKKMVEVQAQKLNNGKVDKKGRIYDSAGNLIAKVNVKNGQMSSIYGGSIGVYKANSYLTKVAMEQAIFKFSPFLIGQRKAEEQKKRDQMEQYNKHMNDVSNSLWGGSGGSDIWGNTW